MSQYANFLNHIIKQQNDKILCWMSTDFIYRSTNELTATLLGFKTSEECIGKTDYDIKCEAVKLADQFREEDKLVLETKKSYKSIKILKLANDRTVIFHSIKKPLYGINNEFMGIYHEGIILPSNCYAKALNYLAKVNPKNPNQIFFNTPIEIKHTKEKYLDLTDSQKECMFIYCHVKTAKSIANILNLSHRTVENHLTNVKNKLNCLNESQLFDKCYTEGYIYNIPGSLLSNGGVIIKDEDENENKHKKYI
jgi:DNA-binding CsgD family transcriptional regulator